MAVGPRIDVLVVVSPGILQRALAEIAALAPIAYRRIGGLLDQRPQALIGRRVLEIVQPVQSERRRERLNVLTSLRYASFLTRPTTCGTMTAASSPMMITTTMISMRVKPLFAR